MCILYLFQEGAYSTQLAEMVKLLADNKVKFTVACFTSYYRLLIKEGSIRDQKIEYAISKLRSKHDYENLKELQRRKVLR